MGEQLTWERLHATFENLATGMGQIAAAFNNPDEGYRQAEAGISQGPFMTTDDVLASLEGWLIQALNEVRRLRCEE